MQAKTVVFDTLTKQYAFLDWPKFVDSIMMGDDEKDVMQFRDKVLYYWRIVSRQIRC